MGTSRIIGPTPPTVTAIDPHNIQSLGRKPWHLIVLPSSPKNGPRNLLTSNRTRGTASTCGSGSPGLRLRRNKSDLYDTHKRRGNLRQLCVVLLYQCCTQLQIPINEKEKIAYFYFLDGRASRRSSQPRDHGGRSIQPRVVLVVPAAHPMERRSAKRTLVIPAEFGPAHHASNKKS